jgi:hypothetical protein
MCHDPVHFLSCLLNHGCSFRAKPPDTGADAPPEADDVAPPEPSAAAAAAAVRTGEAEEATTLGRRYCCCHPAAGAALRRPNCNYRRPDESDTWRNCAELSRDDGSGGVVGAYRCTRTSWGRPLLRRLPPNARAWAQKDDGPSRECGPLLFLVCPTLFRKGKQRGQGAQV